MLGTDNSGKFTLQTFYFLILYLKNNTSVVSRSVIPSFRHSVFPSFCHSIIPSFCHSVISSFRHSIFPSFRRFVILQVSLTLETSTIDRAYIDFQVKLYLHLRNANAKTQLTATVF